MGGFKPSPLLAQGEVAQAPSLILMLALILSDFGQLPLLQTPRFDRHGNGFRWKAYNLTTGLASALRESMAGLGVDHVRCALLPELQRGPACLDLPEGSTNQTLFLSWCSFCMLPPNRRQDQNALCGAFRHADVSFLRIYQQALDELSVADMCVLRSATLPVQDEDTLSSSSLRTGPECKESHGLFQRLERVRH